MKNALRTAKGETVVCQLDGGTANAYYVTKADHVVAPDGQKYLVLSISHTWNWATKREYTAG